MCDSGAISKIKLHINEDVVVKQRQGQQQHDQLMEEYLTPESLDIYILQ